MDLAERVAGGLLGMLVGDALGVPYEFRPAARIPPFEAIEMAPPPGYSRAHPSVPPATHSDDGALALCLLSSLLDRGRLDVAHLAERFLAWDQDGYMAVDGVVFDIGVQTSRALSALRDGVPPDEAGPRGDRDNGNGSLMRVLPLALWHRGSDAELVADARAQSRVTHGHPRSQMCCAVYCLWARRLLEGASAEDGFRAAVAGVAGDAELAHLRADEPPGGTGSGYVVDTLRSARLALVEPGYERVVKRAIALGDDTDTTACVAGGLAGVREGLSGIPDRWRKALRGEELWRPLLERLLAPR